MVVSCATRSGLSDPVRSVIVPILVMPVGEVDGPTKSAFVSHLGMLLRWVYDNPAFKHYARQFVR
eukprot:12918257-Prorocentrum_lima.AAC.1